jgi:uncharacterized protein YkwD
LGDSIVIYVGQELVIPPAQGWTDASPFWIVHIVQEGETLATIAAAYDLDIDDLLAANASLDPSDLQVGDLLVVPLEAPSLAHYRVTPSPTHSPVSTLPTLDSPISPIGQPTVTFVPATLSADIADWPEQTARVINEVRAAHNLPPFDYNQKLAQAAQAHANDCSDRGWCSHTGSDGSDVKARLLRVGYKFTGWSECWAQSRDPNHAVEMWMDETPPDDPHRRTLLSEWVTEIGVGVAQTSWGYYFIADFGRP